MAKCSDCGNKISWRDERHHFKNGIRCQSCYNEHLIHQDELERIKEEKKKERARIKEERRQKRIANERKKIANEKKRRLEETRNERKKFLDMSIGDLIKQLGNPDEDIRIKAAKYLGVKKDRKAVRPLIETLKDRNINVVISATESLSKIGDPRALEELRKVNKKFKSVFQEAYTLKGISLKKLGHMDSNKAKKILDDAREIRNFNRKLLESIDNLKQIKFKRMAKVAESDLKGMSWEDFEDTVIESLDAVPSDTRTGDMGIDGLTKNGVPIQIKQSERIGRNVVDNFQTALRRYYPSNKELLKGIIVAFSFTTGAYTEVERAKREDNIDMQLITADELVS